MTKVDVQSTVSSGGGDVAEPIALLETDGYCVLRGHHDGDRVDAALDVVERLWADVDGRVTNDLPEMAKDPIVWNLQNKSYALLELLFDSPALESILMHFLNDRWYRAIAADRPNYIMRAYVARSGLTPLPLHIDSFVPYVSDHVISLQCTIVLEDMSADNGCTLVVPGSHRSGTYVEQSALADAVPVEARAGDVVLWDSRLWHGASENAAGRTRWALIATFTRWWVKQAFNITGKLPADIYDRLTDSQRAILGFCSIPHDDEYEGVVMQQGYDALPSSPAGRRRDDEPSG